MVRVGGLDYSCDPTAAMGSRITDLRLDDGTPIEAGRSYKVAGWARVGSQSPGPPIWDVVAEYLRTAGEVRVRRLNTPRLLNVAGNPGIET
jgi:sulfur-oxidizing protein SoxB